MDTNVPDKETLISMLLSQTRDVALLLLSADGTLIGWEGACERIFGYARQEVLGQKFDLLFVPEDRAWACRRTSWPWRRPTARPRTTAGTCARTARAIWMSGITIPLRDSRRQVLAYGKIARDRTDLKPQIDTLEPSACRRWPRPRKSARIS